MKKGGGDAGTAKYSSNNIMSLSYAAHINGDKVYDIATGYYIKAVKEPEAMAGRLQIAVYLYSPTGEVADKFVGVSFPEANVDKYNFVGIEIVPYSATAVTCYLWTESISQYSRSISYAQQNSATLKQYFSGEQGYAINADYAVIDVQPLAVSDNGTYTAPFGKAYSPITVDVQEQPWQPLEDGYSNFWFELTNDTLSPWLNFSAKTENAVIDWGDGSGEVALDTLTPTHTYAKAGKYIVKVKGVTGVSQQLTQTRGAYLSILKAVELNDDVTTLASNAFVRCLGLEYIELDNITTIGTAAFNMAVSLKKINIPNTVSTISTSIFQGCAQLLEAVLPTNNNYTHIGVSTFRECASLEMVTIPSNVTVIGTTAFYACSSITSINLPQYISSISDNAFNYCSLLTNIHIAATAPPTLGASVFANLPSDFIIYVPVSYGETYKAAAGWSAYAGHILEEGQTPNRAMLSRLAKAVDTDTDTDDAEEKR